MLKHGMLIVCCLMVVLAGCPKKADEPVQEPEPKAKSLPIKAELLVELPEY